MAHPKALLPALVKLQPPRPRIHIPSTWLCHSCLQRRAATLQLTQPGGCVRTQPRTPAICIPACAVPGLSSICTEISSALSLPRSQSNNRSVSHHPCSLSSYQIKLSTSKSSAKIEITQIGTLLSVCLTAACRQDPPSCLQQASLYLPHSLTQDAAPGQAALRNRATNTRLLTTDPGSTKSHRKAAISASTGPKATSHPTCSEKVSASSVSTCPLGGNTIS